MDKHGTINRDSILELIVDRLGHASNDFSEKIGCNGLQSREKRRLSAGVLLPLHYGKDGFVFHLIKRSKLVPQAGDLSCPGGMLDPFLDRIFMHLIRFRCPPVMTGDALRLTRARGKFDYSTIALFFANALRESWEEIKLNPVKVRFLGPLPSYDLYLFQRSIFPLAGYIKETPRFQLNEEVEKLVEIPLQSFFEERHYAACLFRNPDGTVLRRGESSHFPCFIHTDTNGREEILWGATFQIIMSFLEIVFGYQMPSSYSKRTVEKSIKTTYLTGSSTRRGESYS